MAKHKSERDKTLVYRGTPKVGTGVLTVENYCKWYDLYLVYSPSKGVVEVRSVSCNGEPGWHDHVPAPAHVVDLAERHGWTVCQESLEMITGRYVFEVLEIEAEDIPPEKRVEKSPLSALFPPAAPQHKNDGICKDGVQIRYSESAQKLWQVTPAIQALAERLQKTSERPPRAVFRRVVGELSGEEVQEYLERVRSECKERREECPDTVPDQIGSLDVATYTYDVQWSDEDKVYVARVEEFPSLAAHGPSAGAAVLELTKVVQAVVEELHANGEPIPAPRSAQKLTARWELTDGTEELMRKLGDVLETDEFRRAFVTSLLKHLLTGHTSADVEQVREGLERLPEPRRDESVVSLYEDIERVSREICLRGKAPEWLAVGSFDVLVALLKLVDGLVEGDPPQLTEQGMDWVLSHTHFETAEEVQLWIESAPHSDMWITLHRDVVEHPERFQFDPARAREEESNE